ncbi:MAG: hypothetical protein ACL93V_14765 [Candidatus Electrothrix sp. YB6]
MNPYKLLNVTPEATPQDIVRASVLALQERQHAARDIAKARKQLMNPATKLILDFVYSVDSEPFIREAIEKLTAGEEEVPKIEDMERLDIFACQA